MASSIVPAKTANSRVFVIEGRARPDHAPSYQSCLRMTGLAQGLGDVDSILCPDPYQYGAFVEIGQIRGAKERVTTSLEGRLAMDIISTLRRLGRIGCAADVQLHMGACQNPSNFNQFEKAIILEEALLTSYGTDDLGALEDNNPVNENADISAADAYEVVPLSFAQVAGSVVTNEVYDGVICEGVSCGECDTPDTGCQHIYAVTKAAGGSPSTPADIVYSIDGGVTWYAFDLSLGVGVDPSAVDCLNGYVVVTRPATSPSFQYAPISDFKGIVAPTWTVSTTGIVTAGGPTDIFTIGGKAFLCGNAGYIYEMTDPTIGATVLDAGVVTTDDLLEIHAYSEDVAVAVGNNGAVVYTTNGVTWQAATRPVGVGVNLNTVWVKNEKEWFVGSSAGNLYYTLNSGVTWTVKPFPGSGSGSVTSISFATSSVGFLAHRTSATKGRLYRTFDGGYTWVSTPEKSGSFPAMDYMNTIATCSYDANLVVGFGLADDASDGYIVLGQAA